MINTISMDTTCANLPLIYTCGAYLLHDIFFYIPYFCDSLLKWEDTLRSHPTYVTAAVEASKVGRNIVFVFQSADSFSLDIRCRS
jgi:hypothetical protein